MITQAALTDIGRKRKVNQDYVFSSAGPVGQFESLFILADGMGGYNAGDLASRMLVETVVSLMKRSAAGTVRALRTAIETANTLIRRKAASDPGLSGMGSTVVACVIEGREMIAANVGDSRLYIVRDGLHQVTKDHSLVEEMIRRGELERGSEEYREKRHIITRAVGAEETVDVDMFEFTLQNGDYVLMCSDGLSNMVDEDRMLGVVTGAGSIRYKANTLISMANENGGTDNIAVILLRYEEGGEPNA